MKKPVTLSNFFLPTVYKIAINPGGEVSVLIRGKKTGRPNHRITLHQKGLKVTKATIYGESKGAKITINVARINHLRRAEEVRLHTRDWLYPGSYELELAYSLSDDSLVKLRERQFGRQSLPSIDEPAVWEQAKIEFRR